MIWNENRIGPNRGYHHCSQCKCSSPGFNRGQIAISNAETLGKARVHLDPGFRILIDERTDAASLGSGKILAHDTAGSEYDRVFIVYVFRRRRVSRNVESGLAVRKIEGPRAVGDRIPRPIR